MVQSYVVSNGTVICCSNGTVICFQWFSYMLFPMVQLYVVYNGSDMKIRYKEYFQLSYGMKISLGLNLSVNVYDANT